MNAHPDPLKKIDVIEKLGAQIPLDQVFIDHLGQEITLSKLQKDGKPTLLTFVYYRCPMLCTFVLNTLADSLNKLPKWLPGHDYNLVTISINPEEGPEVALEKRNNYLSTFDNPAFKGEKLNWHFWTSPDNQVKQLAQSVGFQYYYDKSIEEYAHPAVVFLLTSDGMLSRNIYGLTYPTQDIRLGLLEASKGKMGSALEKVLLYCYRYDPDRGSYVLFAANAMKVAGLLTIVLLGSFLAAMWHFEKRKTKGDARA